MATGSVQLNETASAKANAAGNVVIKFNLPRLNRVWQGTIQTPDSPAGTAWSLSYGGQSVGLLYSPGPYGPVQILPSQQLVLTYSGGSLVSGQSYSALLLGVNDPIDNPTPYTGPTSVTSVSLGAP